jgi:hypothetical protein
MASEALRRLTVRVSKATATPSENAARPAAAPEPPIQPDEPGLSLYSIRELDRWYEEQRNRRTGLDQAPLVRDLLQRLAEPGLSPYTIRDLANWWEEEANRRRVGTIIDQDALDRDLCRILAERGVFPEFIAVEFERVMLVVFPGTTTAAPTKPADRLTWSADADDLRVEHITAQLEEAEQQRSDVADGVDAKFPLQSVPEKAAFSGWKARI